MELNKIFFPGSKDDFRPAFPGPYKPPGEVNYWFKQDEIHQGTHVHGGPAFLTWHRELCNRYEKMLQKVDPTVALHYWDCTTDPRQCPDGNGGFVNLFSTGPNGFMGSAIGIAGSPIDSLYDPMAIEDRDTTDNGAHPPRGIFRNINFGNGIGKPNIETWEDIVRSADMLPQERQYRRFRTRLEGAHNTLHMYIGGTIEDGHTAFRDPFVFLLHSNIDRIWASWQRIPGHAWRLNPDLTYGNESNTVAQGEDPGVLTPLSPWCGTNALGIESGTMPVRPWAPPENEDQLPENQKNSRDPTVVNPPEYDEYIT